MKGCLFQSGRFHGSGAFSGLPGRRFKSPAGASFKEAFGNISEKDHIGGI